MKGSMYETGSCYPFEAHDLNHHVLCGILPFVSSLVLFYVDCWMVLFVKLDCDYVLFSPISLCTFGKENKKSSTKNKRRQWGQTLEHKFYWLTVNKSNRRDTNLMICLNLCICISLKWIASYTCNQHASLLSIFEILIGHADSIIFVLDIEVKAMRRACLKGDNQVGKIYLVSILYMTLKI